MPIKSSLKQKPVRKSRREVPVALDTVVVRPSFQSLPPNQGGCCRIRGTDYCGTLASGVATTVSALGIINPRNSFFFPRLTNIAAVFLKFRFSKFKIHLLGQSPSTQRGNCGLMSLISDNSSVNEPDVTTESAVKNTENCLVIKGWENGTHTALLEAAGLKWYNVDASDTGNIYSQGSVWRFTPATAVAGDLTWDVYVEYEIEFDEAVAAAVNA